MNTPGAALFRSPAPTIHWIHETMIQMLWEPTDDNGCLDQIGWANKMLKAAAVTVVQHAANLARGAAGYEQVSRGHRVEGNAQD